jgi:hypothetical protein
MPGAPGGPAETDADEAPYLIVAVLEVGHLTPRTQKNFDKNLPITFRHRWGAIQLIKEPGDGTSKVVLLRQNDGKPLPTVAKRFQTRFDEVFKDKEKPSLDQGLELAKWALEHGLVARCAEVMDKLAALYKANSAVAAYIKVKADLARPLGDDESAGAWRKLLDGYRLAQTDKHHYALLHTGSGDAEARDHLDRLENSLRGYYYWWALHGVSLPVPRQRLLGVLTDKDDDFRRLHKHLTSGSVLADAFVARRENLSVFAARRGDQAYQTLTEISKTYWEKGFNRELLITGKGRAGIPRGKNALESKQLEFEAGVARLQALLLKAMEEEREATGTSHQASRQLLFASGLLPTKVAVPEWIQSGMGGFFETPLQSPWGGPGAASPYWLPRFREYRKGKLGRTPYDTLVQVVTDGYFRHRAPGEKASAALRKARAASWALTYFLAHKELAGLQRYFKELAKMPRDIELDKDVLLACFARAFDCVGADKKVDVAKLRSLATRWDNYIRLAPLEAATIHRSIRNAYAEMSRRPAAPRPPAAPAGPGGVPGVPGGAGRPPG